MRHITVLPNWIKLAIIAIVAFALATSLAYTVSYVKANGFTAPIMRKAPIRKDIIGNKVTAPRRPARSGVAAPPPAPGSSRRRRR